jgi:hypothetical protein
MRRLALGDGEFDGITVFRHCGIGMHPEFSRNTQYRNAEIPHT